MYKYILRSAIISLSLIIFATQLSRASDKTLAIGIGYPYLCLKTDLSSRITHEIRYATGDGINVYALRLYYRFYRRLAGSNVFLRKSMLTAYCGTELGYIIFDSLDIEGMGYEMSFFLCGEYFITHRISLSLDLSPTFISLTENSFDLKASGIEWISSLMLYYHFAL